MDDLSPRPALEPQAAQALSGIFTTQVDGRSCQLELRTDRQRLVRGWLRLSGRTFEIQAEADEDAGTVYGFLLEPDAQLPVALLRARLSGNDLQLELDLSDFAAFSGDGAAPAEAQPRSADSASRKERS